MYRATPDPNTLYPPVNAQMANPLANFHQDTYNRQHNANLHNFDSAFQVNKPMIERPNFQNQNNFIHNNVGRNLLLESANEYVIDIDSYNRDSAIFVDPFTYNVTFAPVTTSSSVRGGGTYIGSPAPYINKNFKNVKYVRVESVILPRYYGIVYDSENWILDTSKDLSKERFVVLKIKNLESSRNLSTSNTLDGNGIKLIPDTIPLNSNYYMAVAANNSNIIRLYNDSQLGNIGRLDVTYYDSFGTRLQYTNLDATVPTTDVRNPLNKYLQNDITLSVGVLENEMNTEAKYNQ